MVTDVLVPHSRAAAGMDTMPPASFAQAVQQLITLGERQVASQQQVVAGLQALTQQVAAAATVQAATGQSPTTGIAMGPLFISPPTLQVWNELLGLGNVTTATIYPDEYVDDTLIPRGAVDLLAQYSVPPDHVAVAVSGLITQFNRHTPLVTALGVLNYGFSADTLPLSVAPVPCDQDFHTPLRVTGAHRIAHNISVFFSNTSRYAVRAHSVATFLVITNAAWSALYQPFTDQVAGWIQAITHGQFSSAVGQQTTTKQTTTGVAE